MSDYLQTILDGYVQIETARLGGRLSNQPEQQAESLSDIPMSSNVAGTAPTEKPFYKKPGGIVTGIVVAIALGFFATRK